MGEIKKNEPQVIDVQTEKAKNVALLEQLDKAPVSDVIWMWKLSREYRARENPEKIGPEDWLKTITNKPPLLEEFFHCLNQYNWREKTRILAKGVEDRLETSIQECKSAEELCVLLESIKGYGEELDTLKIFKGYKLEAVIDKIKTICAPKARKKGLWEIPKQFKMRRKVRVFYRTKHIQTEIKDAVQSVVSTADSQTVETAGKPDKVPVEKTEPVDANVIQMSSTVQSKPAVEKGTGDDELPLAA